MRVAVCRYALNLQTEADSSVGGGRLTRAVLEALQATGHEVVVVGKAGKLTQEWLAYRGIGYQPERPELSDCGAAMVLTGPRNSLYDSLGRTYTLLATLPQGASAAYAQWDVALPFAFRPEYEAGLRKGGHSWAKLSHLRWTLLTQLTERATRAKGGRATAYGYASFEHRRCLFELEEYDPSSALAPAANPIKAFAYFGSDRPGRLREFRRWFQRPGAPPVHVYGRWSEASKAACAAPNVEFHGHVAEGEVRQRLNHYLGTLYMADPAYIASDFVAQRFFENAMAGTAVLYSDKLQPAIAAVVPPELAGLKPEHLPGWFEVMCNQTPEERGWLIASNRRAVEEFARQAEPYRLQRCIEEFLA